METHRRKSSSGDAFSFPSTPIHDDDNDQYQDSSFEFGCVTPDSPSSDPFKDSPADHLFFNGRLLPHAFPFQPVNNNGVVVVDNNSRFTSRTSSISSKDSLMSSRSNSSNSRSSSCSSSARTSYSDGYERKLMMYYGRTKTVNKGVSGQVYGSSQRWQFITPVPASSSLSRESSSRRKTEAVASNNEDSIRAKKQTGGGGQVIVKQQLGRRLFRWFVSACKECHAIEPSRKDKVLRANSV
ncbi:hypothetical protein FNV43_RR15935 [Rhamnella rubrinervis]|uniref:Uncharacterized protein n=1 Tax=Rhamnella rubrinervis TaxID=2594499 RepID=A0A8K0E9U5_9ROSA|nr:hypothetical protein FNV43_RR15935 [Rhamnella rubrinervis]